MTMDEFREISKLVKRGLNTPEEIAKVEEVMKMDLPDDLSVEELMAFTDALNGGEDKPPFDFSSLIEIAEKIQKGEYTNDDCDKLVELAQTAKHAFPDGVGIDLDQLIKTAQMLKKK